MCYASCVLEGKPQPQNAFITCDSCTSQIECATRKHCANETATVFAGFIILISVTGTVEFIPVFGQQCGGHCSCGQGCWYDVGHAGACWCGNPQH